VRHRRREYGPFDYEWSRDLRGVELTYRGVRFGEYCSDEEIFADLKEFSLPMCVVEVASIVLGCIIYGVLHGLGTAERRRLLIERLCQLGHDKFAVDIESESDAA